MGVISINKAKANLYKFAKETIYISKDHKLVKEAKALKKASAKCLVTRNKLPW